MSGSSDAADSGLDLGKNFGDQLLCFRPAPPSSADGRGSPSGPLWSACSVTDLGSVGPQS